MADFSSLKTAIQNAIRTNGNNEITGQLLQDILLSMVVVLGDEAITNVADDLSTETSQRQNADGTLQGNINAEATARAVADTALQNAINTINSNISNGYVYAGIATPSATPVTGKVFYIATTAGTYTNFGGLTVTKGINILKYNGSTWSQEQIIGIDDYPTAGSSKLALSGGIDAEIKSLVGYYTCGTAAATAAKTITASAYILLQGGSIKVKFTYKNTAADATLKIGSADAKPLFYGGRRAGSSNSWEAGEVVEIFYDGTNYMANNVMGGGAGDGAFDISVYNAVDGTPTPYADLAAALGTNGANIPDTLRKGGMSVKFIQGTVQSSDNKYVQYRLMTTAWSNDVSDWQGVDEGPTAGSVNLVKSGGVYTLYDNVIFNENSIFRDGYGISNSFPYNITNSYTLNKVAITDFIDITNINALYYSGIKAINKVYARLSETAEDTVTSARLIELNWQTGEGVIDLSDKGSYKYIAIGIYRGVANSETDIEDVTIKTSSNESIKYSILNLEQETKILTQKVTSIAIIGDSISTFDRFKYKVDGYSMYYPWVNYVSDVLSVEDTWWKKVANSFAAGIDVNASERYSCAVAREGYHSFYDRAGILGSPDMIFVALGTNDSALSAPLGDYDYTTATADLSETTFRTAYIKGIKTLMSNYPNAKIACIILDMEDAYSNSIRKIAKHYNLDYIYAGGFTKITGNIHPNKQGMIDIYNDVIGYYGSLLNTSKNLQDNINSNLEEIEDINERFNDTILSFNSNNIRTGYAINNSSPYDIQAYTAQNIILTQYIDVSHFHSVKYSGIIASNKVYARFAGGESDHVDSAILVELDWENGFGEIVLTDEIRQKYPIMTMGIFRDYNNVSVKIDGVRIELCKEEESIETKIEEIKDDIDSYTPIEITSSLIRDGYAIANTLPYDISNTYTANKIAITDFIDVLGYDVVKYKGVKGINKIYARFSDEPLDSVPNTHAVIFDVNYESGEGEIVLTNDLKYKKHYLALGVYRGNSGATVDTTGLEIYLCKGQQGIKQNISKIDQTIVARTQVFDYNNSPLLFHNVFPRKPMVMFMMDMGANALNSYFNDYVSLFESYGLHTSFAFTPSSIQFNSNNYNSDYVEALTDLINRGHEIVLHSDSDTNWNNNGSITPATARTYIVKYLKVFKYFGLYPVGWLTMNGKLKDSLKDTVSSMMGYCQTNANVRILEVEDFTQIINLNAERNNFVRTTIEGESSSSSEILQAAKDAIDACITQNGFLIFYTHAYNNGGYTLYSAVLEGLLSYLKTKIDNYECVSGRCDVLLNNRFI